MEDGIALRASTALLSHLQKSGKGGASLFEDQSALFLEFRLKKMPGRAHQAPVALCVAPRRVFPRFSHAICNTSQMTHTEAELTPKCRL